MSSHLSLFSIQSKARAGLVTTVVFVGLAFAFSLAAEASANPVFSPDRAKVAYVEGSQLFVGNTADHPQWAKGENDVLLATDYLDGLEWSPDGSRVLYVSKAKDATDDNPKTCTDRDISIVAVDGSSKPIKLVENHPQAIHLFPTWSPDGTKIAFETYDASGAHLVVLDADGKGSQIYLDSCSNCKLETDPLNAKKGISGPTIAFRFKWSPDGTRLVYDRASSMRRFFVVAVDGKSEPTGIEGLGPREKGDVHEPAFSPDGTKIAYAVVHPWKSDLFVIDADGENRVNLTQHKEPKRLSPYEHMGELPLFNWSPDSKRLAFRTAHKVDGWYDVRISSDLYVVDACGSAAPVNLSKNDRPHTRVLAPAWSPSSDSLVYALTDGHIDSPRDRVAVELFFVRASGHDAPIELENTWGHLGAGDPVWSLDGRAITFATSSTIATTYPVKRGRETGDKNCEYQALWVHTVASPAGI